MSKKLDTLLSEEIKRFNSIMKYQEKVNEGMHYKFYEAEEEPITDEPAIEEPVEDPNAEVVPTDMPVDAGVDTTGEEGDVATADLETAEMPAPEDGSGDIEVDVTELVNSTKEMAAKSEDIIQKIANSNQKIEDIINKVGRVEQNLEKMEALVQKMDAMAKQVELMRPPTEEERRKALAKDSYPFNVTQDEYLSGSSVKTQTDLETRPDKLSMMDSLMANYNEMDIKDSF